MDGKRTTLIVTTCSCPREEIHIDEEVYVYTRYDKEKGILKSVGEDSITVLVHSCHECSYDEDECLDLFCKHKYIPTVFLFKDLVGVEKIKKE